MLFLGGLWGVCFFKMEFFWGGGGGGLTLIYFLLRGLLFY